MMIKAKEKLVCPTCGSTEFYEDRIRGELICRKCGTVIEEKPAIIPEWAERERAGPPIAPTRRGVPTEIGGVARLSPKERRRYLRLRIIDKWLVRSKDKTMMTALSEIQRQISYLGLPASVHEESAALFDKLLSAGKVRGWSTEELVTGILFAVARKHGFPRTAQEFAAASGLKERDIRQAYRHVSRLLGLKIAPARAEDYIPRFATLLGLSAKAQIEAKEIIKKLPREVTLGRSPIGITAAALYIASIRLGEKRTLSDIVEATGIAEFTIRRRYNEVRVAVGLEVKGKE